MMHAFNTYSSQANRLYAAEKKICIVRTARSKQKDGRSPNNEKEACPSSPEGK
jgi:hypothetical protein